MGGEVEGSVGEVDASALVEVRNLHRPDAEALVERSQRYLHQLLAADSVEPSCPRSEPKRKGAGLTAGSLDGRFPTGIAHIS